MRLTQAQIATFEQEVIGQLFLMMESTGKTHELMPYTMKLQPSDFTLELTREIYSYICSQVAKGEAFGIVSTDEYLSRILNPDSYSFGLLASLCQNVVSYASINTLVTKLRNESKRRKLLALVESSKMEILAAEDIDAAVAGAESMMASLRAGTDITDTLKPISAVGAEYIRQTIDEVENPDKHAGLDTGFSGLDKLLGRKKMVRGSLAVVAGRPAMGKAQPLTCNVLMADGSFKKMGDIEVGDKLASVDGSDSSVIGVYPQGKRPIYKINLSDGRVVEADLEHLWSVESSKFEGARIMTTKQIIEKLEKVRYKNRLRLTSHKGDFGGIDDIGISGWLLGYLLGDGCMRKGLHFSATEPYILDRVKNETDLEVIGKQSIDYYLAVGKRGKPKELEFIKNHDLYGKYSYEKHIPDIVFGANRQIREQVVAGLLESDGWVEKSGALVFASSSKKLRDDLVRLVMSLGGSATLGKPKRKGYKSKKTGEFIQCRDSHQTCIRLGDESIISSPRLRKNMKPRKYYPEPAIVSVEFDRDDEAQCIMVSHESHLYMTDNYIVTHNTSVMLSILLHAAKRPNAGACIAFSQEMPNVQLFDRIVKQETGIQDDDFNHAFDRTCDTIVAFQNRSQGLQIYMDDQPRQSIDKIKQRARLVAKKQKLDIILVDYLGIMEMPKADRHDISISLITTELKALAKELNCVVVLLSQVNRDCEKRQNKRPTNSDLKDSGAIEQDADYIIFLYRDSVYDEKSIAKDYAELIMSKNRHGQIGTAYAAFKNGAYLDTDQATAYNVCSQVVEKPASRL
jgi:replicative DNA helicase